MRTCRFCGKEFSNEIDHHKIGGHAANCEMNPHRKHRLAKIHDLSKKRILPRIEFKQNCPKCGQEFVLELTQRDIFKKNYRQFCSRKCSNGRIHSESTKNLISETLKQREKSGLNRVNQISLVCQCCSCEFKTKNPKRKYCSRECVIQKYNVSERSRYRKLCQFNFSLKNYPDEFDFSLINEFGWYLPTNRGNNLTGISRDHMISIDYGFNNKIDPKIISHPANCRLLRQSENASKHSKCSIILDELLKKIRVWNEKYPIGTSSSEQNTRL